ncbi:MAG: peptidyl-prolyl cis-trans isomerase B (cyclophilin B) [Porticoccaceae bacterium]|jgi:peptidyl-prolyl cis-trans isomerase B (cyclophilin B)
MAYRSTTFGKKLALISTLVAGLLTSAMTLASETRVIMSTSMGDIVIQLDGDRAPQSAHNFLQYVDGGFYDNTLFHRVIEGFMIQGGGFTTSYQKKPVRKPVSNEAYNGLRNDRYTIAMARTTAPHSATSQFFINSENNRNLNHTNTTQRGWGYTVFGKVVEGTDIVDNISRVRTGAGGPFSRDAPATQVVILSISRLAQVSAQSDIDKPASTEAATAEATEQN